MTSVISFFFWVLGSVWSLIVSNWILSFSVLVLIIGSVVSLIQASYVKK